MQIRRSPKRLQHAVSAERLQMVEQFRRSGLTRKAFSQQYGVPLSTLSWWLSKAKQLPSVPAAVTFRELKVIPTADPPENWAMEVESPSGLKIRCREALPVRILERLLRGSVC